MKDEQMKFTSLKGKLYLKLLDQDPTYTKELEEIKVILPNSAFYKNALGVAIMKLAKDVKDDQLPPILEVVRATGCASEDFIYLSRELRELDGKPADQQSAGLNAILKKPFPPDADEGDKRSFYSDCLNIAIASNNTELITDIIHITETLAEGD